MPERGVHDLKKKLNRLEIYTVRIIPVLSLVCVRDLLQFCRRWRDLDLLVKNKHVLSPQAWVATVASSLPSVGMTPPSVIAFIVLTD